MNLSFLYNYKNNNNNNNNHNNNNNIPKLLLNNQFWMTIYNNLWIEDQWMNQMIQLDYQDLLDMYFKTIDIIFIIIHKSFSFFFYLIPLMLEFIDANLLIFTIKNWNWQIVRELISTIIIFLIGLVINRKFPLTFKLIRRPH